MWWTERWNTTVRQLNRALRINMMIKIAPTGKVPAKTPASTEVVLVNNAVNIILLVPSSSGLISQAAAEATKLPKITLRSTFP